MAKPPISALTGLFIRIQKLSKPKRQLAYGLITIAALALLYLIYSVSYLGRTYPHVTVGGVNFSGLSRIQVEQKLNELVASNQTSAVKLLFNDQSSELHPADISWAMNTTATADMVFAVGRGKPWQNSFAQQLAAPFHRFKVTPEVSFDETLLDNAVTNVSEVIDQPATDASAKYVGEKLVVNKEKVGKTVNRSEVKDQILASWATFRGAEIRLETRFDAPNIVVADEAALADQAQKLGDRSVTLVWSGANRVLSKAETLSLIDFIGQTVDPDQPKNLVAAFTAVRSKVFLEKFAADNINKPATEPKLVIKDGALAIAKPAAEGTMVDLEVSSQRLLAALQSGEKTHSVELTLATQQPLIREGNLAELGIKELIGRGETSFVGSPTNRRLNIINGVSILQSALVKPGDEFSTVKTLGRVDDTTGFLPELVIKENRTTPEFGGGLCQVSTTLFRSVLNAGLKIVERQNHSYRVSYYEPPLGLDATIYLPKPDFRFLNDTPAHILVQGQVVGSKVIFELWGTKDGRVSSISNTTILSTTPAGEPIYADTDTLPKGEVKQIEKAHDGAVTTVTYTVSRNGQQINQQVFKSVYKAWPARFLVGTKEEPAPAPEATVEAPPSA